MVPMNLGLGGAYINTGVWSTKALKEARTMGEGHEVWTDADNGFKSIPAPGTTFNTPAGATYLHYTSSNTIYGTQFKHIPDSDVPLVADMSSDILTRPVDVGRHALIYAGVQKNAGPAGLTMVIADKQFSRGFKGPDNTPTILRYATHATKSSLYNTPPVFAMYVCSLVADWLAEQGGLEAVAQANAKKAARLYGVIDGRGDLFRGHAARDSRSDMNVTFTMPTPELEQRFFEAATEAGCIGVKGHRSVGGLRISTYNGVPFESVEVVARLMESFQP